MKLSVIKNKLFKKTPAVKSGGGLFVTLEELAEQKQYAAYLKKFNQKLAVSNQAGDVKSAFKGRGIELEELRAYAFGDDTRDIDWRVTARKQVPFTRLYAEEKDREIYVLLDLSPSMVFGTRGELKSVAAAKITALLGWLCLENKDRFGVMIFDGYQNLFFKPGNSRAAMTVILKKISEVSKAILELRQQKSENLVKSLNMLRNFLKNQATVFVVSDFSGYDEAVQQSLAGLIRKTRVFCVDVFDVLEENAPLPGEYMVSDGNGRNVVFSSRDKEFRREYHQYFHNKRLKLHDFCKKFKARYMQVRTDLELYKQLKIF